MHKRGVNHHPSAAIREVAECSLQAKLQRRVFRQVGAFAEAYILAHFTQFRLVEWRVLTRKSFKKSALTQAVDLGVALIPHLQKIGVLVEQYTSRSACRRLKYQSIWSVSCFHQPGNFGYFSKSGLRFSRKAFLPSWASSMV